MKKQLLVAAVALAVVGLAGSARASTYTFTASMGNDQTDPTLGFVGTGTTVDTATSFDLGVGIALGGGYYGGFSITGGPTNFAGVWTVSPTNLPTGDGSSLGGDIPLSPNVTKTFAGGGYIINETFTDLTVTGRQGGPSANLGLGLSGTIGANNLGIPVGTGVIFGIGANQVGSSLSWSGNQFAQWTGPSTVPLPGGLLLFGSVIAGAGAFMRRRR